MAIFSPQGITDVGRILLTTVQAGAATLDATRLVIGSGAMPSGATVASMTAVVTPVKDLVITKKKKTNDGKAIFGGVYSNADVTTPFYFREFALYARPMYVAENGTTTYGDEVLYVYGNAGNTADLIPAYSTSTAIEKELDMIVWVGNEAAVNLTIESGISITRAEVEEMILAITPESIGAVPLDGSKSMTGASLRLNNDSALVGASDSRAVLNSFDKAGDESTYRGIVALNKNATPNIEKALCFAAKETPEGGELLYYLYGEHNPPHVSHGTVGNNDLIGWANAQTKSGAFLVSPSTTTLNMPEDDWLIGFIDVTAAGKRITATALNSLKQYVNVTRSNVFSGWVEQYNAFNKPTPDDIGALSADLPVIQSVSVKSIVKSGRYYAFGCTDTPYGESTYGYLDVFVHAADPTYRLLRYRGSVDSDSLTYECVCEGGIWTDWVCPAPAYTYGTADLTAGSSALETGKMYLVYS